MKTIKIIFVILLLSILLKSCREKEKPLDVTQYTVNPAFEMNPPLPKSIFIQELKESTESGNILLTSEFENGLLKEPFLPIQLGDEKAVLNDNGQNGDEIKGDNIFSVILKEDVKQLMNGARKNLESSSKQSPPIQFDNRSAVVLTKSDLQERLKNLDFEKGLRNKLPIELFIPSPDAATLIKIKDHSLMVTNPSVVEDVTRTFNPCTRVGNANGVWTFGQLMKELANEPVTGVNPVDFTLNWLKSWKTPANPNNDNVPARNTIDNIITSWQRLSGVNQPLKLEALPFKLMAIVNRLDLRGNSGYGFSNAGEGRLVFTALSTNCQPLQFTVIFEYGINKSRCADVKAFAQQWYDLQNETIGSATYNQKLQNITDQFTKAGTNPSKPNQSSLNQLRTNEIALGSPWELREFTIDAATHQLLITTTKQEPATIFNRVNTVSAPQPVQAINIERLVKFINDNQPAVEANNYTVPAVFDGVPFLGGKSHTINPVNFHWDGGAAAPQLILSDKARHIFSLNTCSGCHGGEAKTLTFTHIRPSGFGAATSLSGFLTGLGADDNNDPVDNDADPLGLFYVNDPAGRPTDSPRGFNDLARRALDLHNLVNTNCRIRPIDLARQISFKPIRMTH